MRFKPGQRIICTAPNSTNNGFYKGYVHKILCVNPNNSLATTIVKLLSNKCIKAALGMYFTLHPIYNKESYDSVQLYGTYIFTKAPKC